MPIIELKLSGQENPALAQQIATQISSLTKDILKKRPEVTVVTVSFVPDHLWFINSVSLAELNTRSFHLNVKISDSTNLKVDKSNYIKAVHQSLDEILRGIHPVSYTSIQETKADAYGYEGLTIEYKIINNQIKSESIPAGNL